MSKLLGGTSAPAYRFDEPGDGFDDCEVVDVRDVQQRNHDTGMPLFWPAAGSISRRPVETPTDPTTGEKLDPVLQLKVVVDTKVIDPHIPYDDGLRSVYFTGQSLSELRADLKRTRSRTVEVGGRLSRRLTEEERVDPKTGKRRGIAKKIYSVRYEPPATRADTAPAEAAEAAPPKSTAPTADEVPAGVDPKAWEEALRRLRGGGATATTRRSAAPAVDDEPPF